MDTAAEPELKPKNKFYRFVHSKWLIVVIIVIVAGGSAGAYFVMNQENKYQRVVKREIGPSLADDKYYQQLVQNFNSKQCSGTGAAELKASPMRLEDTGNILPLGLSVGAHVTPIDHQYFSPIVFDSPRDAYPVMAMADGYITQIQRRSENVESGQAKAEEYRIIMEHSCTFWTYFDLVTSLSDRLRAEAPELNSKDNTGVRIKISAGEVIGRIGGQTLDTAVYNAEKPLSGFVNKDRYNNEPWKVFTDSIHDYFAEPLKSQLLAKNPRQVEPVGGKIDYDIDGKLIGNWFDRARFGQATAPKQGHGQVSAQSPNPGGGSGAGTGGGHMQPAQQQAQQEGSFDPQHWLGELAFHPDYWDPSQLRVSIGGYQGQEGAQFGIKGNGPNPADVTPASGLLKLELVQFGYTKADGSMWDRMSYTKGPIGVNQTLVQGVMLLQMTDGRTLKFEAFPGKSADQVPGFTPTAKTYIR